MSQQTPLKFFITHSWKDIDFTKHLCDDLSANGLAGFFDAYSIHPGDVVSAEISHGLEACDIYVPILSHAALNSPWCEEEVNAAITLGKLPGRKGRPRIIPILVEDCQEEMPIFLRSRLYINFEGRYDEALRELLTKGFGILPKSPTLPKQPAPSQSQFASHDKPPVPSESKPVSTTLSTQPAVQPESTIPALSTQPAPPQSQPASHDRPPLPSDSKLVSTTLPTQPTTQSENTSPTLSAQPAPPRLTATSPTLPHNWIVAGGGIAGVLILCLLIAWVVGQLVTTAIPTPSRIAQAIATIAPLSSTPIPTMNVPTSAPVSPTRTPTSIPTPTLGIDSTKVSADGTIIMNAICQSIPTQYIGRIAPYKLDDKSVLAEGKQIFDDKCAACHGSTGKGDGPAASVLDPKPTNLTDKTFMQGLPVDCNFYAISEGVKSTGMIPWKSMGEDNIWKVLIYERSFSGVQ